MILLANLRFFSKTFYFKEFGELKNIKKINNMTLFSTNSRTNKKNFIIDTIIVTNPLEPGDIKFYINYLFSIFILE